MFASTPIYTSSMGIRHGLEYAPPFWQSSPQGWLQLSSHPQGWPNDQFECHVSSGVSPMEGYLHTSI